MSWLYTIVFAGLALTSQGNSTAKAVSVPVCEAPAAYAEVLQQDETEKFEQSYPLNANGRVNVSNVNGSITVEAWDRNEVKLEYTKVADTKERLADVEIRIDSRADYFSVETDYGKWRKSNDGWRSGKLNVEIKLMAPRGAMLNEIETVNGSVAVSNFTNYTKVSAVNGSVKANNLRGTAKLSTVNGEVAADFDRLESGSKISLDTVNGKVNLSIPSDSNATLRADSLNGNIANDFGLPVRKGKYIGRDLYGKIGSGDVQIKLDSVNGSLTVSRKNDGKALSPAVNLLPQKEKDGDDWDKDDPELASSKIMMADKDLAKAVKESQKVSSKAMADAKVALSAIEPVISAVTSESIKISADAIARSADVLKSEAMQRRMEQAQLMQKDAMARIANIGFSASVPRVEKKSGVFVVKGTPKVSVEANGSSVKVQGWDRSEVQYRVVQFGDQRDRTPLKFREDHSESAVNIVVENPDSRRGGFFGDTARTRVEVFVPRKSNLKINTDGELRVEGVTGEVELKGSDEPINVRDVDGKLKVSNSDGTIRVIGFRGDIDAETSDGMINLEGDFRSLRARGSDGSISLTLPEGTSADIEANCPELAGDGITLKKISSGEETTKYRIGSGGPLFQIQTDGEIQIRGTGMLRETY